MRVHYINYKPDIDIVFFPATKRFFKVNANAKELINDIVSSQNKKDIIKKYNISEKEYNTYYNNILDSVNSDRVDKCKCSDLKVLNRLVVNITNDCNMRCKYCYADGGQYKSDRGLMSEDVANKVLEQFFSYFDKIEGIQFFGGEPLLNMNLIEYICEYLQERDIKIGYGIVTNGTLANDRFIELVNKYDISVTVSYDGNPVIQNLMRPMANGKGSSDLIIKNMKKIDEKTNKLNLIQATYTQYHADNDISPLDIASFLRREFPRTALHLVPAGGSDDSDFVLKDLDIFPESIYQLSKKTSLYKNLETFSLIDRIFNSLADKESFNSLICDAGFGTISVSTNGDIYPCFMFTDMEELKMGNVFDENVFESDKLNMILDKLIEFSIKDNNDECYNCIIKEMCTGCLGLNSMSTGSPFKLSKKECEMQKKMIDNVIIECAKIIDKTESDQIV